VLHFYLNFYVFEMLIEREVCLFFTTFFTAREPNDRQTFDSMNSIKFRVSLLVKHWTYQTLNECVKTAVVILHYIRPSSLPKGSIGRQPWIST